MEGTRIEGCCFADLEVMIELAERQHTSNNKATLLSRMTIIVKRKKPSLQALDHIFLARLAASCGRLRPWLQSHHEAATS